MKKILGIISSQRKMANGEMLIKEVLAGTGEECQLELVRLANLKLDICRACYRCLRPGEKCPLNDDLYSLLNKLKAADGIILAAPDYVLGPASVTKLFADRSIALCQHLDDLWGKPCVVIGTYGVEGWDGYTLTALNAMVQIIGLKLKDSSMFFGALPGEAVSEAKAIARAREMGKALFGAARSAQQGECPTCRSDIWKFPHPGEALCPICGQKANLVIGEDGITWAYTDGGQRLAQEYLKKHFQEWLPDKVQEFIIRRKELAAIRERYK
jgi:multimeric flavodoxin WrbA